MDFKQVPMSQTGADGGAGRSPSHRRSHSLDASAVETTSRIPIPSSSPRALLRQGSFKMRSEGPRPPTISEWEESKPNTASSSQLVNNTGRLKRHRSLQGLYSSPVPPSHHRHSLTLDSHRDDDQDSVSSMTSNASSQCEHAHFARNGTTYSARRMKYIVHCPSYTEQDGEYLTPTQRANRSIRRLRNMLAEAQTELLDKESEIMRLTKELVEIRLNKANPQDLKDGKPVEDGSKLHCDNHISSTTMEDRGSFISTNGAVSPQSGDLSLSLADSGHFDDLPCNHVGLERELERVKRSHDEMRERYQDKVESLLRKITETSDKFYELKPLHDSALLRVKELEMENSDLKKSMKEQEDVHQSMMTLYAKEKKSQATLSGSSNNQANQTDSVAEKSVHSNTTNTTSFADENVPKILQELEITRKDLEEIKARYEALKDVTPPHDAEMTLQFLKSAIYYFLTDPVNAQGHLTAILGILRYNETQKDAIMKTQVQAWKYSYY